MRKVFVAACLLMSSCASLHEEVFTNIQEGDPAAKVLQRFGQPHTFAPSQRVPGATAWYYTRGADNCAFAIKDEKVAMRLCQANPNYVSPAAAFAKGFKEGAAAMGGGDDPPRRMHCTSDYAGGAYCE